MKRYDSYKDSGVQWIGKIPSHWDSISLLFVLRNKISDGPHETPVFVDDGIPFISIDSLNDSKEIDFSVVKKYISTEDYERYCQKTKLEEGDILFTKAATIGKTAIVRDEIFMVWSPLAILKPDYKKLTSLFLYYLVNCKELVQEAILSGSMSTQINVGMRELEKVKIPIPTLSEQVFISDYLDAKCGEIDKLIATQQRRIELLQELRQSIITRAVTRGINPDAPLRDSGIDWIGPIPTHWEIRKTSLIYNNIGSGTTPTSSNTDYYTEDGDGFYWLQTGDLNDGDIKSTSKQVTKLAVKECKLKFFPEESVVIAMYGATIGKVGLLNIKTATNQACCVLPHSCLVVPKFSFYLYQAAKTPMLVDAIGGGQPNISQDIIKKLRVPLPPLAEQQEIVGYIERETSKVDHALEQAERQIELLQELRQSVITEVVTGKRKVC